ncbi:MAG: nicotinate-nucleotide adenylyltransferase [Gemmataceae bacterium]
MRVGVFGGTFDPVHIGHLVLAEQCREQENLDQVWFIPAARPPHKLDRELTPFAQRVEMLQLALAGNAAFRVEEIEKDRPGPSYTADTLEGLCRQYPDNEWHLLIGSDTLMDLPNWYEPARVLQQAGLLVMARRGHAVPNEEALKAAFSESGLPPFRLRVVEAPQLEIASSDLRRRAGDGRSLRYQVPRAVECYIENKNLYRPAKVAEK